MGSSGLIQIGFLTTKSWIKSLCLFVFILGHISPVYAQSIPRPLFGEESAPGTSTSDTTPFLRWSTASGASTYDVEVRDVDHGELVAVAEGRATTNYSTPALARGRDYEWSVRGCNSSGCSAFSEPYYFNITGTSLDAPNPLFGSAFPLGPVIDDTTPRFRWSSVTGARTYGVLIRNTETDEIVHIEDGQSATAFTTPALLGAQNYKWSVRACNTSGCGAYSNPYFFQIEESIPTASPTLLLGSSTRPGTSYGDTTPLLRWTSVSGATSYDIDVFDLSSNRLVVNVDRRAATSFTTRPLVRGRSYRWTVRACNSAGCGTNSSPSFFTISSTAVDSPVTNPVPDATLSAPELLFGSSQAPGITVRENTAALRWTAVSGATSYDIDVFNTESGERIVSIDDRASTTFVTPELPSGQSYRWNVRACNRSGCSARSQSAFFFVSNVIITPAISILLLDN